jgi:hypothetical protein
MGIGFSGLFAGHKGAEGYLRLTEKLLSEQRRGARPHSKAS